MVALKPEGTYQDTTTLDQSVLTNQAYLGRRRQFPQSNQFGTYDYGPKNEALRRLEDERLERQKQMRPRIDNTESLNPREI